MEKKRNTLNREEAKFKRDCIYKLISWKYVPVLVVMELKFIHLMLFETQQQQPRNSTVSYEIREIYLRGKYPESYLSPTTRPHSEQIISPAR